MAARLLRSQIARANSSTADQLIRFDEEIDSFKDIVANMPDLIVNHSREDVEAPSGFLRSFIQEIDGHGRQNDKAFLLLIKIL